MEFITQMPWTVVPEQSKDATQGLRVINYVDTWVLSSNYYVDAVLPL